MKYLFSILFMFKIGLMWYLQVRVTLKSSSEQRVRFYSLERSSPLLDIGHGTWDIGHRTYNIQPRTYDI